MVRIAAVVIAPIAAATLMLSGCLAATPQPDSRQTGPPPTEIDTTHPPEGGPTAAAERGGADPATPPAPLVVHEWGTFTSVQGADGGTLQGMHHEEESLPAFVSRRRLEAIKGIPAVGEPVTQKLETPVIYFYADEAVEVSVDVRFPAGVFGEWYPEATGMTPELSDAPFLDRVAGGGARWDVTLDPALPQELIPYVDPDDIWAPSREVAATPLRFGEQGENFIFYRGIGRFDPPLHVVSASFDQLVARNDYAEPITAFLIRNHAQGASITAMPPLDPGGAVTTLSPPPKERPLADADFVEHASRVLAEALTATGLYEDEAWAMVRTWSRSWLQSEGLRLLYLVPRSYTDRLLPISITPAPAPKDLVRTLVGRIEILTPEEETDLVEVVRAAADAGRLPQDFDWQRLGRLAEPKLRRARTLLSPEDPAHAYASTLIEEAAAMP